MSQTERIPSPIVHNQVNETSQKSSVILPLIHTTAKKIYDWFTHKQATDLTFTKRDAPPLVEEIITPPLTDIPAGTLHATEPEETTQADESKVPPTTSPANDLHRITAQIPGYSPTTHSISLQEILSNKSLQKVVITLPKTRVKKNSTNKAPQPLENKVLHEFINEDRHSHLTFNLLEELRPFASMGLLPKPSINLGFITSLPSAVQRYVRCMVYFLIVHPELSRNRPLLLTPYQESAFKRIYDIFLDKKYSHITRPLEIRLQRTEHLFYKGSRGENGKYEENREGRISQKGYRNMTLCFLKEFMITDILNYINPQKQLFTATDFDDKEHGFDIGCIDLATHDIGLVDVTFNKLRVRYKLTKLDNKIADNKFKKSEFNDYILQRTGVNPEKIHVAVLHADPEKFLYPFLSYISNVKKGKYCIENILLRIGDRPLPRERYNNFGKANDKEFFLPK